MSGNNGKRNEFEADLVRALSADAEVRALYLKEFYRLPLPTQMRILRMFRGLSQVVLGRKTGLAQPEIARLERGTANPRISTASEILRPLGMGLQAMSSSAAVLMIRQHLVSAGEEYFRRTVLGGRL